MPVRKGGWWYYSRTVEGKQYSVHCRRAVRPGEDAPAEHRGRRAAAGRGSPAGRQRGRRGLAVLLARRVQRQPGREAARLLDRLRRRRALHAADQGPGDRADRRGRDPGHLLRLRLVRGRVRAVLRHRGRGLAALPGVAASGGHPGGRRRDRDRGGGPAVLGGRRADPQRALRGHRHLQHADQRGMAAGRHRADGASPRVVLPRRQGVEYSVEHQAGPDGDRPAADPAQRRGAELRTGVGAPAATARDRRWPLADPADFTTVIAHREDTRLLGVDAFAGHAVVHFRRDGLTGLRILRADGSEQEIGFPEPLYQVSPGPNPEYDSPACSGSTTSRWPPRTRSSTPMPGPGN